MDSCHISGGTSFLCPIPRDRHDDANKPLQRPPRLFQVPPAPEKKPKQRRPAPSKPKQGDCSTQLKIVDKDVSAGRAYIKALDQRFRVLRSNLKKALNVCDGQNFEETAYKFQNISGRVNDMDIMGSELIIRPPEPTVLQNFNENSWESMLQSIKNILPKMETTSLQKVEEGDTRMTSDLQPMCSFRSYNRGQRYGRRDHSYGYGGYNSDFDSDIVYPRRNRGRGRRRYDRYSSRDYHDPYYNRSRRGRRYYGDSDLDYDHGGYYRRRLCKTSCQPEQSRMASKKPQCNRRASCGTRTRVEPKDNEYSYDSYYDSESSVSASDSYEFDSGTGSDDSQYERQRSARRPPNEGGPRHGSCDRSGCRRCRYPISKMRYGGRYGRRRYGGRGRYRGLYSEDSSMIDSDLDMDYYRGYGGRGYYGTSRHYDYDPHRGRYRGYGGYGGYGRGRGHRRYGGRRYGRSPRYRIRHYGNGRYPSSGRAGRRYGGYYRDMYYNDSSDYGYDSEFTDSSYYNDEFHVRCERNGAQPQVEYVNNVTPKERSEEDKSPSKGFGSIIEPSFTGDKNDHIATESNSQDKNSMPVPMQASSLMHVTI